VLELLQDAFKSRALAEKLGGKIAFKSDGVPFFVFEMIRGLKEGQFIRLTDDGTYVQTEVISEIEVPSAVKDLIEGRLRGLSETQRAILDVGAVQGLTFEPGLVAAVLEEKRVRVLRDLAEIERRFGLVRDDGHAVRFDQNQIQEVLYRGLTPHLRAEYHTLIAEEKDDADAYFLALHQLRGARPKGAAPHVEGALKFLKDSHRHEETVTLADLALATPELLEGEQRVEVLLEKAHALYTTKRGDEVAAVLEEARALADTPRLQAKVMLSVAWNRRVAGDAAGALEAVHEARALAGEDRELVTRGYVAEAGTLMNLSRYREALEVFRLAQESPDAHVRADAQRSIATCQFYLGNRKRAHQGYLAALESYRELGDKHGECLAGNLLLSFESDPVRRREQAESLLRVARETGHRQGENWGLFWLATIHWDDGNWAEALAYRLRNLALCRELGDRVGQGIGLVNCGPLYANLGDTRRARGMLEESLAISREVGVPRPESYGLHYLGDLAEQEGRFDDARRLHEEGLALREKTEFALGIVESSAALGLLLCRHGETEAGRVHLERGLQLGREQGLKPQVASCLAALAAYGDGDAAAALAYATEHDAEIDVAHRMHVRRLLWKATGDRGHLEEAYQLLTHLRDHAPEEYRESMIENVPLHKEIMEAWRDR
jgi:tetratricopeptide (TPR) repeat protein